MVSKVYTFHIENIRVIICSTNEHELILLTNILDLDILGN